MTTICWTIIHHAVAPVAHGASRLARAAHFAGPVHPHVAAVVGHASRRAAKSHSWVELVCKTIPAAIGGGGLLIPTPANPPRLPETPPPIIEPGPALSPWSMPNWTIPPQTTVDLYVEHSRSREPAPEPSTAALLLSGGLFVPLTRLIMRRSKRHRAAARHPSTRRSCPEEVQSREP
jgi:hypothetical protein